MTALVYVIDDFISKSFLATYQGMIKDFRGCVVMAVTDAAMGQDESILWSSCVDEVLRAIRRREPSMVIVIGHKGVFRNDMAPLDEHKADVRIAAAEAELAKKLGESAPTIYVIGFSHIPDSEINTLFERHRFELEDTLVRLRGIVEKKGGPFGQLSTFKHDLMRPFTSVRLSVQLQEENGQAPDTAITQRVAKGIDKARQELAVLDSGYEKSPQFLEALKRVRSTLEARAEDVTRSAAEFNDWSDHLNRALDQLRLEAR